MRTVVAYQYKEGAAGFKLPVEVFILRIPLHFATPMAIAVTLQASSFSIYVYS